MTEMNENCVIKIENLSKEYRLGAIGSGTLRHDLQSWYAKKRGKEDPNQRIGAKQYTKGDTFLALDGVNLEVNRGERIGIIGANGAGKSTLLKMITGVAFPDEGEITVDGKVAALLELTAGFSMEMTGRENIYLKGYVLGLEDSYIKQIEEKIIDFAELGDYIDQPVRTYSSGMKMRLGFAINVNIDPDILVIDEALSVGDASFKKKCKNRIAEIIKEGTTVLFVSHSKDSVKEMCTRAVFLKKGRIIFSGSVNEAFEHYEADKKMEAEKKKKAKK